MSSSNNGVGSEKSNDSIPPNASSSAWKKRDQERERRHGRAWMASPEQTQTKQQQSERQQQLPQQKQQQRQQANTPGSNHGPLYRDRGGPEPPSSFGNGGMLGVLRNDLERLNSYFEYHEQRQFSFQQRYGFVDLRALSRIDLHDVVDAVDVQVLQGIMTNVTFSNIRERDLPLFSDHAMIKLIKVLQYSVEYLMNVQNTLLSNLDMYSDENNALKYNLEREKREHESISSKYRYLKRFAKQQKRSLQLYEAMLIGGSAGTYEAAQAVARQRALLKREARRAARGGRRRKIEGGDLKDDEGDDDEDDERDQVEIKRVKASRVMESENLNSSNSVGIRGRGSNKTTTTTVVSSTSSSSSAAETAANLATTSAVSANDMSSILEDIHRRHYQEQLQMVREQLEYAEMEASRQRDMAADSLLEKEKARALALESQIKLIQETHQIEVQKGIDAMRLLQKKKKDEQIKQLSRILIQTKRRTLHYGFMLWREKIQDDLQNQLRLDREKARKDADDQKNKYGQLLARQKAAAKRRKDARAKVSVYIYCIFKYTSRINHPFLFIFLKKYLVNEKICQ
jgi:hypothetical protein